MSLFTPRETAGQPYITAIQTSARCFRGANGGKGTLGTYRFTVDAEGTVRVYDDAARHYTIHHGMTQREESRIRNLARRGK